MKLLDQAPEVGSRNGKTKEITQISISHSDPRDRLMIYESRKEDLIAQIAETLWVIGGSREIRYLSPFLKRAIDYSDNLITWKAGYGYRIRFHGGELDQLESIINILKKDRLSRRAFISLVYGLDDHQESKDIACNQLINFLIRPDENGIYRLNMTVTTRSNDFFWGYTGINYKEFTFLQEFIANILGVELGYYVHNPMSFHLYEPHFLRVKEILSEAEENITEYSDEFKYCPPVKFRSLKEFDELFTAYKNTLDCILDGNSDTKSLWYSYKIFLDRFELQSTIYFEIPILWLCLKNEEFAKDEIIQSYIDYNYYSKNTLFFNKVSKKFQKRIERHLNGKDKSKEI